MKISKLSEKVVLTFFTLLILLIFLFPMYLLFANSLKSYVQIYDPRLLVPFPPNLEAYLPPPLGFFKPGYLVWVFNSLTISVVTAVISIGVSLPAAYAIGRMQFRFKTPFSKSVLLMYMFPSSFLMVGYMKLIGGVGLFNSPFAVALIDAAFASPYCVWLLGGYLTGLAKEIEESAAMDGCNFVQILIKIVLPIMLPAIIASAMYAFIIGWDEYLYALLFLNNEVTWNLNVGMATLVVGDYAPWNQLFALATLDTLPPIIIFIFIQKYIVSGLSAGAMKA
jgi:multiple sugar transport system permease protein